MSAIDTMNHAHVANFFKLPVYWVFEENDMFYLTGSPEDDNKKINQYFLTIGGGSGEHPALIINNDAVLVNFLYNVEEVEQPNENSSETDEFDYEMYKLSEELIDFYQSVDEHIGYGILNKNQWPLDTFVRIAKEFEKESKNDEDLESKIINAVALFIINEMPLEYCIKDKKLIEFAKMYRSNRWLKAIKYEEMCDRFVGFTGVLNCQKSGRIIIDNKVVWGYNLNDWKKSNNIN